MDIKQSFEQAAIDSKSLPAKPDNETLLKLYSLYKQATEGDAPGENNAGMFDFVANAKYNAWKALKGLAAEDAMQQYVALVEQLKK
jgi:diazepam-binding inhibitor (GABA receptor modulator, acyl-CoA-binding protein)